MAWTSAAKNSSLERAKQSSRLGCRQRHFSARAAGSPRVAALGLALLTALLSIRATAAPEQANISSELPRKLQVVMFKKILASISGMSAQTPKVILLGPSEESKNLKRQERQVRQLASLFREVQLDVVVLSPKELRRNVSAYQRTEREFYALYLTSEQTGPLQTGAPQRTILSHYAVLTLSAAAKPVHQGKASIGLTLVEKRPRILVNVDRIKDEGYMLAPGLLGQPIVAVYPKTYDKDAADYLNVVARGLLRGGSLQLAQGVIGKLLRKHSRADGVRETVIVFQISAKKCEKARDNVRALIRRETRPDPDAFRMWAEAEKCLGNTEAQVKALTRFLARQKNDFGALLTRGELLVKLARYGQGLKDLRRAYKLSQDIGVGYRLASGYFAAGRWARALKLLLPVLGDMTTPRDWYILAIRSALKASDKPRAMKAAKLLARRAPNSKDASEWYFRGMVHNSAGKFAGALKLLQQAYELDSSHKGTRRELVRTYGYLARGALRRGQRKEAESLLVAALERVPDVPELRWNLAQMRYRDGDYSTAMKHTGSLLKQQPQNAEAHALAALIAVYLGRTKPAWNHAIRALELDGNGRLAARIGVIRVGGMRDSRDATAVRNTATLSAVKAERSVRLTHALGVLEQRNGLFGRATALLTLALQVLAERPLANRAPTGMKQRCLRDWSTALATFLLESVKERRHKTTKRLIALARERLGQLGGPHQAYLRTVMVLSAASSVGTAGGSGWVRAELAKLPPGFKRYLKSNYRQGGAEVIALYRDGLLAAQAVDPRFERRLVRALAKLKGAPRKALEEIARGYFETSSTRLANAGQRRKANDLLRRLGRVVPRNDPWLLHNKAILKYQRQSQFRLSKALASVITKSPVPQCNIGAYYANKRNLDKALQHYGECVKIKNGAGYPGAAATHARLKLLAQILVPKSAE